MGKLNYLSLSRVASFLEESAVERLGNVERLKPDHKKRFALADLFYYAASLQLIAIAED